VSGNARMSDSWLDKKAAMSDAAAVCKLTDVVAELRPRVATLEAILSEALSRRSMQHTGPLVGGKCTETRSRCVAGSGLFCRPNVDNEFS